MMAPKEKRAEKSAMNCRDNFSPETKQQLPKRAGYRCSFPPCRAPTIGPSQEGARLPQA